MDHYVFKDEEKNETVSLKEDEDSTKVLAKRLARGAICRGVAIVVSQPFYGESKIICRPR
jgi:hypothetical protein